MEQNPVVEASGTAVDVIEAIAQPVAEVTAVPENAAQKILASMGVGMLPCRMWYRSTTESYNRIGGTEARANARRARQRVRFPDQQYNCTFVPHPHSAKLQPRLAESRQVSRYKARQSVKAMRV